MSDWLFEPESDEIVKAQPAEIVEAPAGRDLVVEAVDKLFTETSEVVSAAMAFADIEPGATEPPREWIELYGEEAAQRRFRIAQYAQLSHKEAPFALDMASKVVVAIGRAKMDRATPERQINIAIVSYEETDGKFKELEVEDGTDHRRPRPGRKR